MKNLLKCFYVFVFLAISTVTFSQSFQGKATYMSKMIFKENALKFEGSGINDEMKKQLEQQLKKASEKTYVLIFTKSESIYQEEQKLKTPEPSNGLRMVYVSSSDSKRYKNLKDKIEIMEEDSFGKEFLVTDSLKKWNWKLEQETKKIGDYLCSKATAIMPISEEETKEYNDYLKNKKSGKTKLFALEEPKEKLITVWFTSEIPVNHGPEGYWGLSGLILEVNDEDTILLCSEIVINPKEKIEIKPLIKGKKVNRKEYDKIINTQLESMKDRDGTIKINVNR